MTINGVECVKAPLSTAEKANELMESEFSVCGLCPANKWRYNAWEAPCKSCMQTDYAYIEAVYMPILIMRGLKL